MKSSARLLIPILLTLLPAFATPARAQRQNVPEAAAARAMEALRGSPPRLYAFLREMPKGSDLHSHLSGAVYAESYLRWAVEVRDELTIVNGHPNGGSEQSRCKRLTDSRSGHHRDPSLAGHQPQRLGDTVEYRRAVGRTRGRRRVVRGRSPAPGASMTVARSARRARIPRDSHRRPVTRRPG